MRALLILAIFIGSGFISIAHAQGAPASQCPDLSSTLRFGMTDAAAGGQVSELQRFLSSYYGLDPREYVTGYFGNLTRENVRRFQCERMQLCSGAEDTNGYGLVGPATRAAIRERCVSGPFQPQGGAPGAPIPPPTNAPPVTGWNPQTPGIGPSDSCVLDGVTVPSGGASVFYAVQTVTYPDTCGAYAQARSCVVGVLFGSPRFQYARCTQSGSPAPGTPPLTGWHPVNGTTTPGAPYAQASYGAWHPANGSSTPGSYAQSSYQSTPTTGASCVYSGATYVHNQLNNSGPGGFWLPMRCCNGEWRHSLGNAVGAPLCESPYWN